MGERVEEAMVEGSISENSVCGIGSVWGFHGMITVSVIATHKIRLVSGSATHMSTLDMNTKILYYIFLM